MSGIAGGLVVGGPANLVALDTEGRLAGSVVNGVVC